MKEISVLLVDDHDIVRTGLRSFLEDRQGIRVVGEAGSGTEALRLADQLKPDIALMDISMPDMDGLLATRMLRKQCPGTHVLALTIHDDKHYFMEMMAAGASGYLTKYAAPDELVAAIDAVAQGQLYLQPALARWLLEDYQCLAEMESQAAEQEPAEAGRSKGLAVLTPRERQVLELIAQGLGNQEIGKQLGLSHKTVARHRDRIMQRLDLHSRTELVKFAIRTGLISLE